MVCQERISLVALAASVAGTFMLLFLSETAEPMQVKIGQIDSSLEGSRLLVKAEVKEWGESNGTNFLSLYDGTGEIKAVAFSPDRKEKSLLWKGNLACFKGKVQLYRGELELVLEGVEECS